MSGFVASVLVVMIMHSKAIKRMVYIGCFLPLLILTVVTMQRIQYNHLKNQETAAKLLDSVINKESKLTEAYLFDNKIKLQIEPGDATIMGAQITSREFQVVISLAGAEKLNEIYLMKNGVAMMASRGPHGGASPMSITSAQPTASSPKTKSNNTRRN